MARAVREDEALVLSLAFRPDRNKKGTVISVQPKDDYDSDFLEMVVDSSANSLDIFASINGVAQGYTFENAGVQYGKHWNNITISFTNTEITLYSGCVYVATHMTSTPILSVFDHQRGTLALATGYIKANNFRVRYLLIFDKMLLFDKMCNGKQEESSIVAACLSLLKAIKARYFKYSPSPCV